MRENVNFAFYVSGRASRLRKFLEKAKSEDLKNIKFVLSDESENTDLEKLLKERNITWITVNYKEIDGDKNLGLSNELLMWLKKYKVDYCFSFGAHILKGDILQAYENRIINFHPSLLPMYPGKKAIDQAVQGERAMLLGNTAHFIDEGIDTGKIIMQSVMTVERFKSGGYDAVLDVQVDMLDKLLTVIRERRLQVIDGNPIIVGADYSEYHIYPEI